MKNLLRLIWIAALVAVIGFTIAACNNGGDEGDNNGYNGNGDNGSGATISASGETVYILYENGTFAHIPSNTNLEVYADIWGGNWEEKVKVGDISGGKLIFELPDISGLIAKNGITFAELLTDNDYVPVTSKPAVSPPDAKVLFANIYALSGSERHNLYYSPYLFENENMELEEIYYMYFDKSATIKGTFTRTYSNADLTWTISAIFDCTLKKGWNTLYLYSSEDQNTETWTTTKPAGTLRWIIYF